MGWLDGNRYLPKLFKNSHIIVKSGNFKPPKFY